MSAPLPSEKTKDPVTVHTTSLRDDTDLTPIPTTSASEKAHSFEHINPFDADLEAGSPLAAPATKECSSSNIISQKSSFASINGLRGNNLQTTSSNYNNDKAHHTGNFLSVAPSRPSVSCARTQTGDCAAWPGKQHWKNKAKQAKMRKRSCTWLAGLSKRNQIIVKVLIGFLIIGIAVGVGVGISKPLGAGIWTAH